MTPAEMREKSRLHGQAAIKETDPLLKRKLANDALALAQLAEMIERNDAFVIPETDST